MKRGPRRMAECEECQKQSRRGKYGANPEGWIELQLRREIRDLLYEHEGKACALVVQWSVLVCSDKCLLAWAKYRSSW